MTRFIRLISCLVLLSSLGEAHVGSPDIYLDGQAGPYKLFVTIRPPQVIPGVADILVRCQSPGVTEMRAVPLPLSGPGADHPPIADALSRSVSDPQFFTGSLWLMADGSWQVRITAQGVQGSGVLSVPVPAVAQSIRRMDGITGGILALLGCLLIGGLVAICAATVREAKLGAGAVPGATNVRNGRIALVVSLAVIVAAVVAGRLWWDSESDVSQQRIYRPLNMRATLNGHDLQLDLSEPGWMQAPKGARLSRVMFVRRMDDFVTDHNHLMHLYAIREPGMDVLYHLHPDQLQAKHFHVVLPAMPEGSYKLYADVVHENGLPETLSGSLHLAQKISVKDARPLVGDDARLQTTPLGAMLGDTFVLPDGYRMRWLNSRNVLHARQGSDYQFELVMPDGTKPEDMALYMGMLGHAAFVKSDGTTFAHIHPNGTVSMSALMMAQGKDVMAGMQMAANETSPMQMQSKNSIPNRVSFPYGLPTAGNYRIFVQMKHGGTVETAAFDACAQ